MGAYLLISGVTLAVALYFAMQGLWTALPYAGLEILALGAAFYISARQAKRRELITIDERVVRISRSGWNLSENLAQLAEFPRGWAQVVLQPSRIRWYPSRLLLRAHGKELEVGSFLAEDERQQLAKALSQAVAWN